MEPSPTLAPWVAEPAVTWGLAASGTWRAPTNAVAALRQMPGPRGNPLPNGFLKHADEQTLVGLAAVFQSLRDYHLLDTCFTEWGVLAAPRFLGRACLAVALQRFALEGAWGVSPHLIPHRSLHSLSGTVSQALGIHGPNFGVGGGPDSASEVLLAAAALLAEGQVPGVWVVLTGCDPEPVLDGPNISANGKLRPADSAYVGAALALIPLPPDWDGPRLTWYPPGVEAGDRLPTARDAAAHDFSLEALLDFLEAANRETAGWRLRCGGRLHWERVTSGAENRL